MTLRVAKKRKYTIAEYLAFDETHEGKFEFHDGEIVDMSGGSVQHGRIISNVTAAIHKRLAKSPCFVLNGDVRIRINKKLRYLYPDISVVCTDAVLDVDDKSETTITNPRTVVEVLSDSTEKYNRGLKFELYRELDSLREYVLVSQHEPLVEIFSRSEDGTWSIQAVRGLTSKAKIPSLKIRLPLSEIYLGIKFTTSTPQAPEPKRD